MAEQVGSRLSAINSLEDDGSSDDLMIERSASVLLGIVAGALGIGLMSLAVGEQWIVTRRHGPLTTFIGWLSFLFCVAVALFAMYRFVPGPKFPVRLRSSGLARLLWRAFSSLSGPFARRRWGSGSRAMNVA